MDFFLAFQPNFENNMNIYCLSFVLSLAPHNFRGGGGLEPKPTLNLHKHIYYKLAYHHSHTTHSTPPSKLHPLTFATTPNYLWKGPPIDIGTKLIFDSLKTSDHFHTKLVNLQNLMKDIFNISTPMQFKINIINSLECIFFLVMHAMP